MTFCIQAKRLDRFAWNFQGRCGVTTVTGRPHYILCQFGEPRDAAILISFRVFYTPSGGWGVINPPTFVQHPLPGLVFWYPRNSSHSYFGRLHTRGLPGLTPTLRSTPPRCQVLENSDFFVSNITRKRLILAKRLNRFAWNFQGSCGVTTGRPHYILGQFGETVRCRDTNFFVSHIMRKWLDRFAWMHHSFCTIVCYRALRSAILATAGLLVKYEMGHVGLCLGLGVCVFFMCFVS